MGTETKVNEFPISIEELKQKRSFLDSFNAEIGTIIEVTQDVWEIL